MKSVVATVLSAFLLTSFAAAESFQKVDDAMPSDSEAMSGVGSSDNIGGMTDSNDGINNSSNVGDDGVSTGNGISSDNSTNSNDGSVDTATGDNDY